nr:DEAD/DEAH box helicase family protein [uncultured Sulfitobacter sp.]
MRDQLLISDSYHAGFIRCIPHAICATKPPKEITKRGGMPENGSIFFTTFQTLTTDQGGKLGYEDYAPDFFDFIIIDECHRSGANAESS